MYCFSIQRMNWRLVISLGVSLLSCAYYNCTMTEPKKPLSVGLPKKNQDNKIEDYIEMVPDATSMGLGPDIGKDFE
jgi:hypothetical protein